MLTRAVHRILPALLPAVLYLSACSSGASSTPKSFSPSALDQAPTILSEGGPRPLTSKDSLASVARDSTESWNLNASQLATLNRITVIKGVQGRGLNQKSRTRKNVTTTSNNEHANIGTFFDVLGYNGVYANQSWAFFTPTPGTQFGGDNPLGGRSSNVVFADTTKGPGNECFESGSGYWAAVPNDQSSSPLAAFYVFDFCMNGGQFVVVKPLGTSAWYNYSRFVQHTDGTVSNLYTIENFLASDGNWHAMLYNQSTATWETLAIESGSSKSGDSGLNPGGEGWSFTEYYNEPSQPLGSPGYCQNIGYDTYFQQNEPVQATAFLLPIGSSTLVPASPANSHFRKVTNDPSGVPQCLSTQQDGSYPSYVFEYVNSSSTDVPAPKWRVITHNF